MKKKSDSTQRFKLVKKRLADGSIKEYRYPVKKVGESEPRQPAQGTLAFVIKTYERSVEFQNARPNTKRFRVTYLKEFDDIATMPIQDIKRRNILTIRDMLATCRGPGSANGFLTVARSFFSWAISREWMEANPASGIKPMPSKPFPAWTPQIVQAAMERVSPCLQRVIIMGIFTGQRRSDLCRMRWSDISDGSIHVQQEKTGQRLRIPIHPTLQSHLDQWRHDGEFILTNSLGGPWLPGTMSAAMYVASQEGRIPKGFGVHGLRKLAATLLAEAGCSMHEIASITGHKTLAMVQHYTMSASQEKLAKGAIVRMDTSFLNGQETD